MYIDHMCVINCRDEIIPQSCRQHKQTNTHTHTHTHSLTHYTRTPCTTSHHYICIYNKPPILACTCVRMYVCMCKCKYACTCVREYVRVYMHGPYMILQTYYFIILLAFFNYTQNLLFSNASVN